MCIKVEPPIPDQGWVPDLQGTTISYHTVLKKNVCFYDIHNMQGYEEQLLNAMYDFEVCAPEQEVISPMIGIARLQRLGTSLEHFLKQKFQFCK